MVNLIILPILVPLTAAIVSLLFWGQIRYQRLVSLGSTGLQLIVAVILINVVSSNGIEVLQAGAWAAPYGITIAADRLSALMILLSALMGFAVALYSMGSMDRSREQFGYYPLLQILLMGVNGAFLTGDLFNLYVWFEVMLIASFVLLALGGKREQLEGGIKYVTLNLLSSAIFLAGVGCIYGIAGTLNMADLAVQLGNHSNQTLVRVVAMLFLVSFGIKAAVFPLFFWLPASYHTPPVAVSAIFAGLLTKVGVYALIRVFTLIFGQDFAFFQPIFLTIAALTMVTGVLGAAAQWDFRRTLSFHIVSQIGYMLLGLAIFTPLALAGSVFYIAHHIIVKTNLFLISGLVAHLRGSFQFKKLGGVYKTHPWLSIFFLISALSLAGIPPLSGFWGKFVLLKAGIDAELYLVSSVALLVGLMTLYSMTKVWAEVFWKDQPTEYEADYPITQRSNNRLQLTAYLLPIVALAGCTLVIGCYAETVFNYAQATAQQLLNPSQYIEAVLASRFSSPVPSLGGQ